MKIGKIIHLQEEQKYLLSYKILESKELILDIKSKYYLKKIKILIKKFDVEVYNQIFEFTELGKSINETMGKKFY